MFLKPLHIVLLDYFLDKAWTGFNIIVRTRTEIISDNIMYISSIRAPAT